MGKKRLRKYRRRMYEMDRNCHYCGKPTIWSTSAKYDRRLATLDHIIPRCCNGSNKQENLVLACARCNQLRDTIDPELFKFTFHVHGRAAARKLRNYKNKPQDRMILGFYKTFVYV